MLPNPKEYNEFKMEFQSSITFDTNTPNYDLDEIIRTFRSNKIPKGALSNLIDVNLLESCPNIQQILKKYITFDIKNNSLCIVLENKALAVHRAYNHNGLVKWKTYGSKKHIQYSIKDNIVFVVYGMAEILLCEIFNLSYIGFQADSIAKIVSNNKQFNDEIMPLLEDKTLVLLLDNDDSCRSTIEPLRNHLKGKTRVIPLEMQNLYNYHILGNGGIDKELPKGYDFRDLCNEIKDHRLIQEILNDLIEVYDDAIC